jgi:hypothetical protein
LVGFKNTYLSVLRLFAVFFEKISCIFTAQFPPLINKFIVTMSQRTVLSDTNDIRIVAKDISVFSCRKRIFKARFHHFTDAQNIELEKAVVRYYSLNQHSFWNILPGYTFILYLFLVVANIISYTKLGLIPIILLYIPFALVSVYLIRIAITWYAKKSLLKLAHDLELQNAQYSFAMSARQK